eukprot:2969644-Pleurochrysis_carterae.AAC.10
MHESRTRYWVSAIPVCCIRDVGAYLFRCLCVRVQILSRGRIWRVTQSSDALIRKCGLGVKTFLIFKEGTGYAVIVYAVGVLAYSL